MPRESNAHPRKRSLTWLPALWRSRAIQHSLAEARSPRDSLLRLQTLHPRIDGPAIKRQNPPVQLDPSPPRDSAWESLRWRGLFYSCLLAVREVFRPLLYWHAWHVFSTDLGGALPEPYAKEKVGIKIFSDRAAIEPALSQIAPMGQLSGEQIRSRLEAGGAVAIACVGGEPAGYMWLTLTNGWELVYGVNWILRSDEALRYGSFVAPKWRGLGIHSSLNSALNCYARDRGLCRTLGSIGAFNRQSLNLAKHARRPKIMTVFVLHINGVNWTLVRAFGAPLGSRFSRQSGKETPSS
jgi:GNAT superfamily N-acetyltransferase